MNFKILLDFKKFSTSELITFVLQVIFKTDGVVTYAALQAQVDIVKASSEAYIQAVEAASDGGKTLIFQRKQQRLVLLNDMQDLVLLTKFNAKGDKGYAIGAGFNIKAKSQRSNAPLAKPVIKYLRRGKKSGTIEGELVDFPKGVREFSILHSTDGGVTETNGTSTSGKRFILDLGITKQEVLVRGYFLGTFQRKSDVCEPMEIFVL